jgi:hypothetical protein
VEVGDALPNTKRPPPPLGAPGEAVDAAGSSFFGGSVLPKTNSDEELAADEPPDAADSEAPNMLEPEDPANIEEPDDAPKIEDPEEASLVAPDAPKLKIEEDEAPLEGLEVVPELAPLLEDAAPNMEVEPEPPKMEAELDVPTLDDAAPPNRDNELVAALALAAGLSSPSSYALSLKLSPASSPTSSCSCERVAHITLGSSS